MSSHVKIGSADAIAPSRVFFKLNKKKDPFEFNQISDEFNKVHGNEKVPGYINSIYRIQNHELTDKFEASEKSIRLNNQDPNIHTKFHGTDQDAANSIIQNGFRLPNHAGMFGKGIYFATNSHKSHHYTKSDQEGYRYILVCRVIIGKYLTKTSADPKINQEYLIRKGYHSVYACRNTRDTGGVLHDEFIVYDTTFCLPVYLIKYSSSISPPIRPRVKLTPYMVFCREIFRMQKFKDCVPPKNRMKAIGTLWRELSQEHKDIIAKFQAIPNTYILPIDFLMTKGFCESERPISKKI